MSVRFPQAPLLGKAFPLAEDVVVRLRLAHYNDWPAIAGLLARRGSEPREAAVRARDLVQFDPRRSYVVCACALIDSAERLVGVGAIDLSAETTDEPGVMVFDPDVSQIADPEVGEALTGLLWGALVGAAQATARAGAA